VGRSGAALALTLLLVVVPAVPAFADLDGDLAEVQQRIDRFRDQVDATGEVRTGQAARVLEIAARLDEVSAHLTTARERLAGVDAEVVETEAEVAALSAALGERTRRLAVLRSRIEATGDEARRRVVNLYMSGGRESAETVLSAGDPGDALVGLAYAERVQQAADRDITLLEHLRREEGAQISALTAEEAEMERRVTRLEDRRAERALEAADVIALQEEIAADLAEQQALLDEIDAEIYFLENEIAVLAAEEEGIKALIRREQSGGGDAPGMLLRPVNGPVVSPFGMRLHPIYGDWRMHTGMDIDAACGVPIVAAAAGRVFLSGWKGGYGLTVMIDHGGGLATLYAHQSVVGSGYGQQVSAGEVIGYIGTTGVSTGCHLHFEVRVNGAPVDPAPYL